MELLYFPRTVSAQEALELGLATQVVPQDDFAAAVADLAPRLADGPTVSFGSIRQAVAYSAAHPLEDSLAFEAEKMALTGGTEDHLAAVNAFVAKEKPVYPTAAESTVRAPQRPLGARRAPRAAGAGPRPPSGAARGGRRTPPSAPRRRSGG